MSRKIALKESVTVTADEAAFMNTEKAKLIFTVYQGRQCALTIRQDRLIDAYFFSKAPSNMGAIYIGKIKSIAKNLDACFVEIAAGEICFLSLKNMSSPYLLNRSLDGRILEGDELLVQVVRDAQKGKRASVTTEISLSNDYFALILGSEKVGFSSKLNKEKKNNIKKLLTKNAIIENGSLTQNCETLLSLPEYNRLRAEGMALDNLRLLPIGMIVRTRAGESSNSLSMEASSKRNVLQQFYDLSLQFIRLLYIAMSRSCFTCLKKAPLDFEAVVQKFIMENGMLEMEEIHSMEEVQSTEEVHSMEEVQSNKKAEAMKAQAESKWYTKENTTDKDFSYEIITDQETLYPQLKEYCDSYGAAAKEVHSRVKVRLYQDKMFPLSVLYSIDKKLGVALDSRVWLKSGGYLVIEPTEALTVIDVNSGKYEAGKNPEDAYRKINQEAAREIALQLRLRNLSGIIIVDFINMESVQDNKELLAYLRTLVKSDRVSTTIVDITALGLVEITRKKINKPLREQFMSRE